MVPRERIELSLPKEPDFESGASTSSATPARLAIIAASAGPCRPVFREKPGLPAQTQTPAASGQPMQQQSHANVRPAES